MPLKPWPEKERPAKKEEASVSLAPVTGVQVEKKRGEPKKMSMEENLVGARGGFGLTTIPNGAIAEME